MTIVLPPPHAAPLVAAYLDTRLAFIEALLERAADAAAAARLLDPRPAVATARAAAVAAGVDLPDAQIARAAGLSPAELDLLWLVAAPAIDPVLGGVLRRIDAHRAWIDPALAGRTLAGTRADRQLVYAALAPDAPLRRAGLIRAAASDRVIGRDLTPASWVPAALRGVRALGVGLESSCALVTPSVAAGDVPLPERAAALRTLLAGALAAAPPPPLFAADGLDHPRGVAVLVQGAPGSGRGVLVRALAGQLGRRLLVLDAARLRALPATAQLDAVDAACAEAAAFGELLVVRDADEVARPGGAAAGALARAVRAHPVVAVLVVADDAPLATEVEHLIVFRHRHEPRPQSLDAVHLWLLNLPPTTELDTGLELDAFARTLELSPVQIRTAARAAVLTAGDAPLGAADLDRAARAQLGPDRDAPPDVDAPPAA